MLKLTRKTEYALMALGRLSLPEGDGVTKVREIADTCGIPFPVLAKVMQRLARQDFVEPVQGAQGGYRLKARLADVSLWQFLERMEGPLGIVDCISLSEGECTQMESCSIRSPMRVIDHTLKALLTDLTLEQVVGPYMRGRE